MVTTGYKDLQLPCQRKQRHLLFSDHRSPQNTVYSMAKGSLKKTTASNAAARRNIVIGTAITQVLHVVLLTWLWSSPWTRSQKLYYFLSTGFEGFLVFTLLSMSAPRRDAAGNIVSAGEDLGQSGKLQTIWLFAIILRVSS